MSEFIGTPAAAGKNLPDLVLSERDDPAVIAEAARDDYALHVVPRTWRLPAGNMAMAWSAFVAAMFWVIVAAGASLVVGTRQALVGLVAAVVVQGALGWITSRTAAQTGLTVGLFSRALFGYKGASIATLALALTGTWFAVFEGSVLAVAAQAQFGGPIALWYGVVTAIGIPLAIGGVRVWLERVNALLLPVVLVGIVATVIWATAEYGYSNDWLTAEPVIQTPMAGPGWLFVFAIYMGTFSNFLFTFDFARMARVEDTRKNGIHTFGFTFYLLTILVNGVVGIYLIHTLPLEEVSEAGLVRGIVSLMGVVGLLYIVATQTKINTGNFYVASSNFESFFSRVLELKLSRTFWVFVVGIVSFAMMILDIFSFITTWLAYQGTILVAWVGIALVFIVARRRAGLDAFEFRPGRVPDVNPGGLVAWIISSGVGIWLIASQSSIATTWALLITFALSMLVSGLSFLVAKDRWFRLPRPHDPRSEVLDAWDTHIRCHRCEMSFIAVEMDRDPSAGHQPICAACGTGSMFRAAALAESIESRSH